MTWNKIGCNNIMVDSLVKNFANYHFSNGSFLYCFTLFVILNLRYRQKLLASCFVMFTQKYCN